MYTCFIVLFVCLVVEKPTLDQIPKTDITIVDGANITEFDFSCNATLDQRTTEAKIQWFTEDKKGDKSEVTSKLDHEAVNVCTNFSRLMEYTMIC